MNSARQVILGILAAILSAAIVLGSFSLAFIEGGTQVALATKQAPVFTPPPTSTAIPYKTSTSPVVVTTSPTASPVPATPTVEPSLTASLPAATETGLPSETPTDTPEPETPCGLEYVPWRFSYTIYEVQAGDNLFAISEKFKTSVEDLQIANCIKNPSNISTGFKLYVPKPEGPQPTPMPHSSRTPTETIPASTLTQTPVPATNTPTSVPSPTDTATQLPPTSTPIPKPPTEAPPPRIPTNTPETPAATSETPSAPAPTLTTEGTPDL